MKELTTLGLGLSRKALGARDRADMFNLVGNTSVLNAMNGVGQRWVALFFHGQDNAANPTNSYEWYLYANLSPSAGLIGWGSHGFTDGSITSVDPIVSSEVDISNMFSGVPQLPFDRTLGAWDDDDGLGAGSGLLGRCFDVSAAAFTDPALVERADFTLAYSREFGFDGSVDFGDIVFEQHILTFQAQTRDSGGALDNWLTHSITGTFLCGIPAENATGALPIIGPSKLQIGYARDFDTPTINGGTIGAGAANSLGYASVTIPSGAAGTLPSLTVHSEEGSEFDNPGTRFVSIGSFFISASATEGLAVLPIGVPFTGSFDYATGSDFQILQASTYVDLFTAIGYNCLIFRVGWTGAGFLSSNNYPDMLAALRNTTDPKTGSVSGLPYYTAPFGDYKVDYVESMDDWQGKVNTGAGVNMYTNPELALPTLYIQSHFMGLGTTLAEADVIRKTERKALEWGITHPTDTPNHLTDTQVWLYNAAVIDPWHDISVTTILIGQSSEKYIRANGTQIPATGETWGASRSYVIGDVICDVNAADYLLANEGWYYCNANHTSAASGTNGPPSDGTSTRWTKVDFRLSDVGKQYEASKIAEAIAYATARS